MSLNLIDDAWIPVVCEDGRRRVIAPWQMAEVGVLRPDWPRPDLNLACYELLIGLVFMADPPRDVEEWEDRFTPDPARLKARLAPYAPAFNLLGDGPRFLQDLEVMEGAPAGVDMLFIDSSGGNTAKNNADLMVHRDRYHGLDLPLAAMALYTFQNFAPSGGAGNRTSMRGGGPMVTLLDPQSDLWQLVWANMPYGQQSKPEELPWMRPTRVSTVGLETHPPEGKHFNIEAFFGMPRRLRLVEDAARVTGVVQRPWGTNYAKWVHPLSPYYRMKAGAELLPKHPRAGRFGYRNWLGVVTGSAKSETQELAWTLRQPLRENLPVIVAGWSMDNMKPRDFIWSVQPRYALNEDQILGLEALVAAAEAAGIVLRGALEPVVAGGEARDAEREQFFTATEPAFLRHLDALIAGQDVGAAWLADLRAQALAQFNALALPALDGRDTKRMKEIIDAQKGLGLAFAGYGKYGKEMFERLGLALPVRKKEKAA